MATLQNASESSRSKFTVDNILEITSSIGVKLPDEYLEQWRELIATVQDSIDVVQSLPDYVPSVDLEKYPRQNIHRPQRSENSGNAWAFKVRIEGASDGPLKGTTFCLKDNIAIKDVPMLVGTDVFMDYVPDVDASEFLCDRFFQCLLY